MTLLERLNLYLTYLEDRGMDGATRARIERMVEELIRQLDN